MIDGSLRVSIIMPLHNAAAFAGGAIASVQAQTFTDWELLVADDASTDATADIVEEMARNDPRIKLIRRTENGGPTAARNQILALARGRFIAFLDGDDLWLPHKLATQIPLLENGPHALSFASYGVMDHSGRELSLVRKVKDRVYTQHNILTYNVVGCLTCVVDTQKTGPFEVPNTHTTGQDYALWLSLLRPGRTAIGVSDKLGIYRLTKNSYSSRKLRAAFGVWRVLRKSEKFPLWRACWYFSCYALFKSPRVIEKVI